MGIAVRAQKSIPTWRGQATSIVSQSTPKHSELNATNPSMARQFGDDIYSVMRMKQSIQNEDEAAYKFFMENKDTLCSVDNLGTASKVIRHQLEISTLKNDRCIRALKVADEKRKKAELEHEEMKSAAAARTVKDDNKLPVVNFMRPVPRAIRKTLYEGISATGGGRYD